MSDKVFGVSEHTGGEVSSGLEGSNKSFCSTELWWLVGGVNIVHNSVGWYILDLHEEIGLDVVGHYRSVWFKSECPWEDRI